MEPSVKIIYSESYLDELSYGKVLPLGEANRLFEVRDAECELYNTIENVMYEISYCVDGSPHSYCCSQYLGDGDGSVINHIRKHALDALQTISESCNQYVVAGKRNPFATLQRSYDDMLNRILPELEAYCIAFKTCDTISSFFVDNCDVRLLSDIEGVSSVLKEDPEAFIEMLDEVIDKNEDNTSLINSIEVLIIQTQRYARLVNKTSLEDILTEATQKATAISSGSILDMEEPYFNQEYADGF